MIRKCEHLLYIYMVLLHDSTIASNDKCTTCSWTCNTTPIYNSLTDLSSKEQYDIDTYIYIYIFIYSH